MSKNRKLWANFSENFSYRNLRKFVNLSDTWENHLFTKIKKMGKSIYGRKEIDFPNYNQHDATFLDLFISTDALHVSGCSSVHHQEHKIYIQLQVLSTVMTELNRQLIYLYTRSRDKTRMMMGGGTA